MSLVDKFEFEAPQYIDSWENAVNIEDGADNFFDALEDIETEKFQNKEERGNVETNNSRNGLMHCEVSEADSSSASLQSGIWELENVQNSTGSDGENLNVRRLSLKRKSSPIKEINAFAPSSNGKKATHRFQTKQGIQFLPTIAESPVLLTKSRVRTKAVPSDDIENRIILRPRRKKNIGLCIKPLPKPPTIPEPFNLTGPGTNVHSCLDGTTDKTPIPAVTPGKKPSKIKRREISSTVIPSSSKKKSTAFSFYERDKEIMKRKQLRMTARLEENDFKHEFRARSPLVLKKEPFRPELTSRTLPEPVGPGLCTEERAKLRHRKEDEKQTLEEMEHKKIQELENSLFIFKAQSGPKGNSSFLSTASSSKRNFFNRSVVSSIGTCDSMPFSFYERDMELLKRKEERLKQVDAPKCEFKAKEPTVLKKEPFYPEIRSRTITEGTTPDLATEERADQWKKIEMKRREDAARHKVLEEELKKAEQEEIRKFRKTLEFKATAIKFSKPL